jgi:hypothetical protein
VDLILFLWSTPYLGVLFKVGVYMFLNFYAAELKINMFVLSGDGMLLL